MCRGAFSELCRELGAFGLLSFQFSQQLRAIVLQFCEFCQQAPAFCFDLLVCCNLSVKAHLQLLVLLLDALGCQLRDMQAVLGVLELGLKGRFLLYKMI